MHLLRLSLLPPLMALATAVLAHHSNTPFDMSQRLEATGVVKKADFRNPHSLMTLTLDTPDGPQDITWEGHSLATLRHYGLGPSTVRSGDTVTIAYAPRRDDELGGIFLVITTARGEVHDFSQLGYD